MPPTLPLPADVVSRSLYLFESTGIAGGPSGGEPQDPEDVLARSLYLYVNEGIFGHPIGGETLGPDDALARALYLYYSAVLDIGPDDVDLRALYEYLAYVDTEPFPWIERIVPNEQYRLGQVDIYGDGFGDTQAAEGGQVKLNAVLMGVVAWAARSPGLHPGPGPLTTQKALTVTVPAGGDSGLVTVELTT